MNIGFERIRKRKETILGVLTCPKVGGICEYHFRTDPKVEGICEYRFRTRPIVENYLHIGFEPVRK